MSSQKFHCPNCRNTEVRTQPIKCDSCGKESSSRPVVVTGEMQNMLASAEEYVGKAVSILVNVDMNIQDDNLKKELKEVFTLLSLAKVNHEGLDKIFNSYGDE